MSDEEVKIVYAAKDQAVLQALQNTEKALARIADRMSDVERKSRDASHAGEEGFKGMAESLKEVAIEALKIVGAFTAIEKILELIKQFFEDIHEQQEKAKQSAIDYGKELKKTVQAAGGFMKGPDVDKKVRDTAQNAHVDPNKAAAALNAAWTAAGVRDAKDPKAAADDASKIAEKELKLHGDEPAEDIGQITGAAARIKKAAPKGTTDEEVVGTLELAEQQSGLQGEGALAKHFVPRLLDADKKGLKIGQFSALYAGLARQLGDQTGKLTDTAIVELLAEIKKHFPDANAGDTFEKMMAGGAEGNALTFKLYNKTVGKGGVVEGAKFSDKTEEAVTALIGDAQGNGRDAQAAADYQRRKAALNDWHAGGKFFRDQLANLGQVGPVRALEREEASDAAAKGSLIARQHDGDIAAFQEDLEKNLAASGADYISRTASAWRFGMRVKVGGESPSTVAEEILERRAEQLEMTRKAGLKEIPPSETDLELAKNLRGLVQRFREQDHEAEEAREGRERDHDSESAAADAERERQGTGQPHDRTPVLIITRGQFQQMMKEKGLSPNDPILETVFDGENAVSEKAAEQTLRRRTDTSDRAEIPAQGAGKLDAIVFLLGKLVEQGSAKARQRDGNTTVEVRLGGHREYPTQPRSADYSR
jgi:hypothetical protein